MARRRSRWPKASRYTTRRRRGRRSGPGGAGVIVVLLAIAAAIFFIPRMHLTGFGRKAQQPVVPAGAQALADSTDAATKRGDWDAALTFALDLARVAPDLSGAQRKLSIAWHNYGTGVRTVNGIQHSARRTSLDKIDCEIRALTAADSARALAGNAEEWVEAAQVYGKTLEYLGLPIDAFSIYSQILQRKPDFEAAKTRAYWLREHLRNPRLPDQL